MLQLIAGVDVVVVDVEDWFRVVTVPLNAVVVGRAASAVAPLMSLGRFYTLGLC